MNLTPEQLIENLNNPDVSVRLDSLKKLKLLIDDGKLSKPEAGTDVNSHIHTFFSFSPYSPTKAVWMAYNAGLATAGIMDHDSIAGAREFTEAGKIIGIPTTVGVECRVSFADTTLKDRKMNNPDQKDVVYMALHGIPHTQIGAVADFFRPYMLERNKRNFKMVRNLNKIFEPHGITLDFEKDVVPVSKWNDGGSITERHLLYALSLKLISSFGKGASLVEFLKTKIKLNLSSKIEGFLVDTSNPYYEYDLLGVLKSDLVETFYVEATTECPDVKEVIAFAKKIQAISAYAYLGDVGSSVTGDKKTQKFEDDFIDELFNILKQLNFNSVTYMPSRNTLDQLKRVKALCDKHDFFQISGEDINTPRQSFICPAMRDPEFSNLTLAAWALIGHEKAATKDLNNSMFSEETRLKYPDAAERINYFAALAKA